MASKYNFSSIEAKWQKAWRTKKTYEPDLGKAKKPFYNLMMFPYPSAEGLHVGNMYAFVGSDIHGRFKRLQGYDVFEPIGLDGFGIHSENYAIKIGAHPMKQAEVSEKRFYKQLELVGNGFAWNEHLETYDVDYYRWTQWIFTQLFKKGLAYRKKQAVNWCPSCQTVLADEQVIAGKCERCSSVVVKKELEQWFFKITAYAERLVKNLDKLDWSEKVKIAQRNWIGKSEGAHITFKVANQTDITVFTTRPDTIYGATYVVIAPEHPLLQELEFGLKNKEAVEKYVRGAKAKSEEDRIAEGGEKTGIELKGVTATNPATGQDIPVWVADYVLGYYGTGAIMAVPAHDERDFEFATKFKLPIVKVVTGPDGDHEEDITGDTHQCFTGDGVLVNSGDFDGQSSEKAKWDITTVAGGKRVIQYRLRDWLISRQRYWGPPIPMVFCPSCAEKNKGERKDMPGWYAVSDKELPVKLPFVKEFRPTGKGTSPLGNVTSFYETKCPSCKGKARRETDVSDTFLDSAWYYLRYVDPTNKKSAFNTKRLKKWFPVDMYIGGAEHAVLHLLYVRFIALFLCDQKLTHFEEPFKKFRAHGLLIKDGAKMSKSKGNVINPDEYIKKFGADTLRMYLMFLAPFEQGGDFRDQGVIGVSRFLERVWKMGQELGVKKGGTPSRSKPPKELERAVHRAIKKVTEDIENLRYNTAVSALMILLNEIEAHREHLEKKQWEAFLQLIAPFAPHIAEELWQVGLKNKGSVHRSKWPKFDSKLLVESTFKLVIQINGKTRHSITVPHGTSESEAKKLALAEERVQSFMTMQAPKRVIYVPGRLINIVL